MLSDGIPSTYSYFYFSQSHRAIMVKKYSRNSHDTIVTRRKNISEKLMLIHFLTIRKRIGAYCWINQSEGS